jgi:uncharacterized membrane protein YuzA (DUF378 family)
MKTDFKEAAEVFMTVGVLNLGTAKFLNLNVVDALTAPVPILGTIAYAGITLAGVYTVAGWLGMIKK